MAQLLVVIGIYILLILLCFLSQPKKILLTPQFCYIVAFLPGMMYAIFYVKKWELQLADETMIVLLGGALSFFIVAICFQTVYRHIHPSVLNITKKSIKVPGIFINKTGLYILTAFDFVTFLWSMLFIIATYGANLSRAIYSFRVSYVLGENDASFGTILSNFRFMSFTLGLIWGYLIVHGIIYKKKKNRKLYIINYLICIVTDLLSGARGDTLLLIGVTLISLYFIYGIKTAWKSNLRLRTIIKVMLIMAALLLTYRFVGNLLGRGEVGENSDFIAKYLSAEFKNLDTFIRFGEKGAKPYDWLTLRILLMKIGQYTFNPNIISSNRYVFGGYLGFASVNGFNLGNVYTAYYSYVHDLGIAGSFIFPSIMALVSQMVFWRTIRSAKVVPENKINIWIIIYGYMLFTIALSFFSDRFFAYIFNLAFIKRIIFINIGIWLLNSDGGIRSIAKVRI